MSARTSNLPTVILAFLVGFFSSACSRHGGISLEDIEESNLERLESFIIGGGNPDCVVMPDSGITALAFAAGQGNLKVVRLFVENGADIDLSGKYGVSPLFYALGSGDRETIEFLIAAGASLSVTTRFGESVLERAIATLGTDNNEIVTQLFHLSGAREMEDTELLSLAEHAARHNHKFAFSMIASFLSERPSAGYSQKLRELTAEMESR